MLRRCPSCAKDPYVKLVTLVNSFQIVKIGIDAAENEPLKVPEYMYYIVSEFTCVAKEKYM